MKTVTKRAVKPLNRLDEEVVESQTLEVSKRWVDVAPGDMFQWWFCQGFNSWAILVTLSNLNDSVILSELWLPPGVICVSGGNGDPH